MNIIIKIRSKRKMIFNGKEYLGVVKGVDSIVYVSSEDDTEQEIIISDDVADEMEYTKREMNYLGLALIPYCARCKEPTDWDLDNKSLICPKCKRIFIREGKGIVVS
jgi:predicted Zn-ribbon and HTH transcriptional regulator